MKRIVPVLIFLLAGSYCNAQLNIVLENQYEEKLDSLAVTINGTGYVTDETGMVSVNAVPSDVLTIVAEGHKTTKIAVAEIPTDRKVIVKRSFTWKDILNPMFYIINGGLWLILFIIFAETGLFAGFFLPGDSLLFVAGITSSELVNTVFPVQNEYVNLLILIILISFAGIIGNSVGYWFGKKVGPRMYTWKDRMLFKKKYLHQAHEFYEKHGGIAIVGARFLPMVRTFAPIIAGIVEMDKKKFTYYNIIGSFLWVSSLVVGGHFLQKWISEWFGFDLKSNLEYIVIGIVLVTTGPVLYKMFFSKSKSPTLEIGRGVMEEEVEKPFKKNHSEEPNED
jgi:membrane-associated protein